MPILHKIQKGRLNLKNYLLSDAKSDATSILLEVIIRNLEFSTCLRIN